MRYENTKTGAVIDSPFPVTGNYWVPTDNPNQQTSDLSIQELRALVLEQQAKIDELESLVSEPVKEEVEPEETEPEEQEVDLQSLTNKQLDALAKEQGIELTADDKRNKDTRITAIVNALG